MVFAAFDSRFGGLRFSVLLAGLLALAACGGKPTVQAPLPPVQAAPAPLRPSEDLPPLSAVSPSDATVTAIDLGGPIKVGLLLPLSGRYARIGEAMLNAAQLALFDIADEDFSLVVRDTGGTPQGAVEAGRAVMAENVRLILGPLFATSVDAIAPEARAGQIPVIAFSNDRSVAGSGVYVMGLAPQPQIDRMIAYASKQGLSRFAVMAPSSPYGQAVVMALQESVQRYGVSLSRVVTYPPDTADVTLEVRNLADYDMRHAALLDQRRVLAARGDDAAKLALKRLDGLDTLGQPDFDAVILPEAGKRLQVIAPSLAYYDIDPAEVRFLGTSIWEDPNLGREPSLAGGWFAAPQPELWQGFAGRYKDTFGDTPPRVVSLAYDATALAAVLARGAAKESTSFAYEDITITQPSGFAGIDGVFRFLPDGVTQRRLAVLELMPDGYKVIDPAQQGFQDNGF